MAASIYARIPRSEEDTIMFIIIARAMVNIHYFYYCYYHYYWYDSYSPNHNIVLHERFKKVSYVVALALEGYYLRHFTSGPGVEARTSIPDIQ